ncbi:glutathione S-transferase N-terminal domain-containing protein, partial [Luteimonas sp. J16]
MITIHGTSWSGNCHKLKLLLSQLGRGHHWREVDLLGGDTRTPEFLAKNPNGKVPVLELGDGRVLVESNAILHWL